MIDQSPYLSPNDEKAEMTLIYMLLVFPLVVEAGYSILRDFIFLIFSSWSDLV